MAPRRCPPCEASWIKEGRSTLHSSHPYKAQNPWHTKGLEEKTIQKGPKEHGSKHCVFQFFTITKSILSQSQCKMFLLCFPHSRILNFLLLSWIGRLRLAPRFQWLPKWPGLVFAHSKTKAFFKQMRLVSRLKDSPPRRLPQEHEPHFPRSHPQSAAAQSHHLGTTSRAPKRSLHKLSKTYEHSHQGHEVSAFCERFVYKIMAFWKAID